MIISYSASSIQYFNNSIRPPTRLLMSNSSLLGKGFNHCQKKKRSKDTVSHTIMQCSIRHALCTAKTSSFLLLFQQEQLWCYDYGLCLDRRHLMILKISLVNVLATLPSLTLILIYNKWKTCLFCFILSDRWGNEAMGLSQGLGL